MKNILMIAYFYPPKGGGGVQRTLKFVKYLNKMGYKVSILTVREETGDMKDMSMDTSYENVRVYRTDIKEINLLGKLNRTGGKSSGAAVAGNKSKSAGIKRIVRNIAKKVILDVYNMVYVPDDKCGWTHYAVEEGKRIIGENAIDVIYTTSSPYTSHMIGYELSKATGLKWVADFRDPWASNQFVNFNYFVRRMHYRLEARVVERADRVLSVSQPIIDDFLLRYPKESKDKFVVIPNGYDEDDFKGLELKSSKSNKRFVILYNGMIYGKRSPEKILSAIDNLIKSGKVDSDKIEIKFQGQIGNEHMGTIAHYMELYPGVVKHTGQVGHKESLLELSRANALLLIIDEGPGSEGIFTGKIFEYIRAEKIILGIVPDGVAKDLIHETKTGYTASPSSTEEIEEIIFKAYDSFMNGSLGLEPDYSKIEGYSRENLTKKLISVMENM